MTDDPPRARIPPLSLLLGFGPVSLLALAALAAWVGPRETLWVALALGQVWAAALVLFLAGVRRGLSFFTEGGARPAQIVTMAWLFLLGLAGLLLPAQFALPALIVAMGGVALTDPPAARRGAGAFRAAAPAADGGGGAGPDRAVGAHRARMTTR